MTTTYTFDQLKEDVRKEAEALRVHATKEEREKLDNESLKVVDPRRCIYGQMTGDCYNKRAAELIKSCTRVFFDKIYQASDNGISGIGLMSVIEQDPFFVEHRINNTGMSSRYSAIEAYILLPEANNANLIAFITGETETLEL